MGQYYFHLYNTYLKTHIIQNNISNLVHDSMEQTLKTMRPLQTIQMVSMFLEDDNAASSLILISK